MLVENQSDNNEQTSLLPQNLSTRRVVLSHLLSIPYNIPTVLLYFASANGFLKHLVESADSPAFIRNQIKTLDHNITDLTDSWQYGVLAFYLGASLLLISTNQRSMPTRIQQLFGWQGERAKAQTSSGKKYYMIAEAILSAGWKTAVSSTSLLALFAPYAGFYPSLAITMAAIFGNVFAQMTNFLDPFFKRLGVLRLPESARKAAAAILALGYSISNAALYFNTIDQGPQRINWIPNRLLQIESLPVRILVNSFHIAFSLNFAIQSYRYYYKSIYKLIGADKNKKPDLAAVQTNTPLEESDLSEQEDTVLDITAGTLKDLTLERNKFSFWQKTDKWGAFAAGYKTLALFLAVLAIIQLAKRLDSFSASTLLIVGITLLLQIPNYISQLTFYSNTRPLQKDNENKGIAGIIKNVGYFSQCCQKNKTQREESDNNASVVPSLTN